MTYIKTRIWRGGIGELQNEGDPAQVAAPAQATHSSSAVLPAAAPAPDPAAIVQSSPAGASLIATTLPPSQVSGLATTRFFPIEELFPAAVEDAQPKAPVERPSVRARLGRLRARLRAHATTLEELPALPTHRRWPFVAAVGVIAAGLLVMMVAARAPSPTSTSAAARPAKVPATSVPSRETRSSAGEALAGARVNAAEASRATLAAPASRSAAPVAGVSERNAIDTLIAGNLEDALLRYRGLAARFPEREVFSAAERILEGQGVAH